ncbi:MAG: putative transporter ATP-binding protein [Actinomycetia bacterium]|jgi:energy-coupling factor transport system ATP-binding protein|nr:putative transporter ATP-binding protein [Actinomycetes bacterium]MDQ1462604.1 energy-coupling factor transport system ATP-binding protein [Actinomycetota bacterium]
MSRPRSTPARRGRLGPGELAEAVVLADVSLALTVLGQVVPLGSALLVAAVVPLAVVAARHRLRAVITGTIAASAVGFLVIGSAAFTSMGACAALGALVGAADRRNWTRRRTMVEGMALLWPPTAVLADLLLLVFANLRRLTLDQVRNGWNGFFHVLRNLGLVRVARVGEHLLTWIVREWWISVPLTLFVLLWFGIWLAIGLSTPALRRVRDAFGAAVVEEELPDTTGAGTDAVPEPLPVALRDVSYRYPNAHTDALVGVNLEVHAAELVAVVGSNGSGKSTLARLLAGRRAPSRGELARPGVVGLGREGGTAIVSQRPEAQVLGVRVRDDVVWGMPDPARVDVDAFLERVGLRALADRETSTLSGGELQRLAIAAALARAPRLLISDESTAMVDATGRAQLVTLFDDLAHRDRLGVVHVTHRAAEAAVADRTITLARGRIVDVPARLRAEEQIATSEHRAAVHIGGPLITLEGVGHVYSRKTPWANRALSDVDLTIREGEAIVVVGHNGSGKSTLAWILSGLLTPSEGSARLDGKPIFDQVGRVGLSFQHSRLQLLRPTVLDEVRSAGGVDEAEARVALKAVGLDPSRFASRRVDELSGGQMRRVVIAGVLASQPRAIILDEPFAGLDANGRFELDTLLTDLRQRGELTLVIVSHDRDLPDGLVDRIVELEAGRITRDEPLEDARPGSQP